MSLITSHLLAETLSLMKTFFAIRESPISIAIKPILNAKMKIWQWIFSCLPILLKARPHLRLYSKANYKPVGVMRIICMQILANEFHFINKRSSPSSYSDLTTQWSFACHRIFFGISFNEKVSNSFDCLGCFGNKWKH